MKPTLILPLCFAAAQLFNLSAIAKPQPDAALSNSAISLKWDKTADGWKLSAADVAGGDGARFLAAGEPSGRYRILYSDTAPDKTPVAFSLTGRDDVFPEPIYKYPVPRWAKATIPAALNIAGEERAFFPSDVEKSADGSLVFRHRTDVADISARWSIDPSFPGDVLVTMTLTARKPGWFSLPTPTLASVAPADLKWAVVPGYFKGDRFNSDLPLALAYGYGLPDRPVIVNEGAASTLASIITNKSGVTLAVIAEPGIVDPYPGDAASRESWRIGLSHMNRAGELAPTLYRALLGSRDSRLGAGETLTFSFRYSLGTADWFAAIKHAARDIYRLDDFLALKKPARSLSQRLRSIHKYVTDDATSLWHTEEFGGMTIGAQAYNGGVIGAQRDAKNPADYDAMKNSDYGAMWMLARLTGDPRLVRDRLPFARNFKLVQQQASPGFFQGAALGQYYLAKSRRFVEEWGDYVEPIAITYYTMLDLGNILLFEPGDTELRERLRLGAERLLHWQRADGSWAVAYDHATHKELFTELPDARSTFYGLIVAYRILGDEKYLAAARRGADWLIENAVKPARFLGVCGDARFAPDFATVQLSQALLDLFELTRELRYRDAAIETARQYLTEIFTQSLATNQKKTHKKNVLADWQLNQTGLAFEHGGSIGTASGSGPILLASYAGLYVRMARLTGEPIFRDLARAAALARDAFLHPDTQVATYYWLHMNAGPGSFPHHAWWQFGWITDYLISEIELRSAGGIVFPRGFLTPKVGPHACFGFAPGRLYGELVQLAWGEIETGMPEVDYVIARDVSGARNNARAYVILLNNSARAVTTKVSAPPSAIAGLDTSAKAWTVDIPAYGLTVLTLEK